MAKKTTRKRMSKAPPKKSAASKAKRDTYNIMGGGAAGKAIAKRKATSGRRLSNVMKQIRKTRGK